MHLQDQQQRTNRYSFRTRGIILSFAIVLIVVGTFSAILTGGGWATVLSLILTALGVVVTFCQIAFPSSSQDLKIPPAIFEEPVTLSAAEEDKIFRDQYKANLVSSNYGVLIVYTDKECVGCIVSVYLRLLDLRAREYDREFRDLKLDCIAQRQISNYDFYAAVFPKLKPNTYHVELQPDSRFFFFGQRYRTAIEVSLGQVAEVDWRHDQI